MNCYNLAMARTGRPKTNPEICIEPECSRRAVCKGRCDRHYRQHRRDSGEIPRIYQRNRGQVCAHTDCDLPAERRGYCTTHYARWLRNGDTELRRAPNGAGHIREDGRMMICINGRLQNRARHVMEEHLGRHLHEDESVHHKNGDVTDDRLENLELRARYHGRGQAVDDLVDWAHEVLERYEN